MKAIGTGLRSRLSVLAPSPFSGPHGDPYLQHALLACFYPQAPFPIFLPTWLGTGQDPSDTLIPLHLGEEAAEAQRPKSPRASLAKLETPEPQACTSAFLLHSPWA